MKTLLTHPWILGTILGDTYIDPLGRMYCAQSLRQESYLLCKCHQLQDMGALAPNAVVKKRAPLVEPITPFARKHNFLSFARISIALAQNNLPWVNTCARKL